ncbi:Scaffold-type E3 ligase [Diatrype stigma]|uniref:Defective in cullin neddylation protein n=1 Tax=Diatrype stigma TaxID=117547 RepID=A0AAN9UYJ5_9PEZI
MCGLWTAPGNSGDHEERDLPATKPRDGIFLYWFSQGAVDRTRSLLRQATFWELGLMCYLQFALARRHTAEPLWTDFQKAGVVDPVSLLEGVNMLYDKPHPVMVEILLVGNSGSAAQNKEAQLNKMFDDLKTSNEDDKDTLGAESTMNYLQNLGANLEDASFFIILEIVRAPSIGEISREGFVEGWKATGADARSEAHKQHFSRLLATLSTDKELFKKVYRNVFVVGKERDQRALALDTAITYWTLLFSPPGRKWVTHGGRGGRSAAPVDFLEEWKAFLAENWTRSVNRDMWNQTLEFAFKTMEDETLGFWSEDGAWPGVIDDFVAWFNKKKAAAAMDVDA